MRRALRPFTTPLLALLAVLLAGCFNPFSPRIAEKRSISEPAPRPDSPRNTLLLFKWCWEHRDYERYRELFTDDFRFAFAATDTFGNAYLVRGWTRDDELESARHLFLTGTADQPVASQITLDFDPNLLALPDSRPGKNLKWHREISTRVNLSVDISGETTRSTGSARFFMVRGDSALIPTELGFASDSGRWYIERYEEEETGLGGLTTGMADALGAWPVSGFLAPRAAALAGAPPRAPAMDAAPPDPRHRTARRSTRDGTLVRAAPAPLASQWIEISWGHLKVAYR